MIPIPLEAGICGICRDWLPEELNYVSYSSYGDLEKPGCCPQLRCCAQNVHSACLIKELVRKCPDWGKGHGCVSMGCPFCSEKLDESLACEAVCTDLMYKISLMSGGLLEAFKVGEMERTPWAEVKQDMDIAQEVSGNEERAASPIEAYWQPSSVGQGHVAEDVRDDSQLEAGMFDIDFQPDWEYYGRIR